MTNGRIIDTSGLVDEASNKEADKDLEKQLLAAAVAGLKNVDLRFVLYEGKPTNITSINDPDFIDSARDMAEDYGLRVVCGAGAVGKSAIVESAADLAPLGFMTDAQVLESADLASDVTARLKAPFFRGFTFYHPKGEKEEHWAHARDLTAKVVEIFEKKEITYVAEPEIGLTTNDADTMIRMAQEINNVYFGLLYDAANLHIQHKEPLPEFIKLVESGFLAYMHIKAYSEYVVGDVDPTAEATLSKFCSTGREVTNHAGVLAYLHNRLEDINAKLMERTGFNLIASIEGHMRGGGRLGGWSGPGGFGVALRAWTKLCETYDINPNLRTDEDVVKKPAEAYE